MFSQNISKVGLSLVLGTAYVAMQHAMSYSHLKIRLRSGVLEEQLLLLVRRSTLP